MKILITGGCGFLGCNLASFFIKRESLVYIIDNFQRVGSKQNLQWLRSIDIKNNLNFAEIDITNQKLLEEFIQINSHFDYVIHVAGQVAMTTSLSNPKLDFETNVVGTFNLLESIRKYSPNSLFAYSSTNKVYGDLKYLNYIENDKRYSLENQKEIDENTALDFTTPYGCSKGAADQYVKEWGKIYGLKTIILRHSSIYGGRQFSTYDQGWIGWFCKMACEQEIQYLHKKEIKPFFINGNGKQVRDILNIEDILNLYWLAYLNKEKLFGEVFNIGGGFHNSLSLLELFEFLSNELNIPNLKFLSKEKRISDQDYFVANIEKANTFLGWKPNVSYKVGIRKMIDWSKDNLNI